MDNEAMDNEDYWSAGYCTNHCDGACCRGIVGVPSTPHNRRVAEEMIDQGGQIETLGSRTLAMVGSCVHLSQDGKNLCLDHNQPEHRFEECSTLLAGDNACLKYRELWQGQPSAQNHPGTQQVIDQTRKYLESLESEVRACGAMLVVLNS